MFLILFIFFNLFNFLNSRMPLSHSIKYIFCLNLQKAFVN